MTKLVVHNNEPTVTPPHQIHMKAGEFLSAPYGVETVQPKTEEPSPSAAMICKDLESSVGGPAANKQLNSK